MEKNFISKSKINKNGEAKSSSLNEDEVSSFLIWISRFDVIVEVICTDLGGI
ncbi:hypothetical protein COXBURSA334_0966 [Coxiella burnetii Q321]|nr:hypothetical protein COXBURSA334_0966 [Coxiella burnetii Q321]